MKKYIAAILITIFSSTGILFITAYFGEMIGLINPGKDPLPEVIYSIPLLVILGILMAFLFNYRQIYAAIAGLCLFVFVMASMFYFGSLIDIFTGGIMDKYYWRHLGHYFLPISAICSLSILAGFGVSNKKLIGRNNETPTENKNV